MTKIRLPLQIGTSSLWSLARSSTLFPGIVFIGLGIYVIYELLDWDKLGWGAGGSIIVVGVIFLYYAARHMQLALAERPSDIVIDEHGVRIEGGIRDGLTVAWSEIDASRCELEDAVDERFVLWRAIVNIPGLILGLVSEGGLDILIAFTEKTPIKRLYIAKRGNEERTLFAEGDIDVEQQSLEALLTTMRSPRFQAGEDAPKKAEHPHAILCPSCGASIAPVAEQSATCTFCNHSVSIPSDVRERVAAAASLASTRKSGLARLERLLDSQPSATRATTALVLAAIPILLAWPITAYLVFRGWQPTAQGVAHVAELMTVPLLLTLGAFLLARAQLTDRFAFHAVVVGFGAREPARPGEPYRCRACEAPLPDVSGTPIVRCVYCHQDSVLGLDLRADVKRAQKEHETLDKALAQRSRERWLWTFASLGAFGLFALAWLAAKPSLKRPPPTATELAFAPPAKFERGAVKFKTIALHAALIQASGPLPFDPSNCDLYVAPSGMKKQACRVRFVCSGEDVFGDRTTARDCFVYDDRLLALTANSASKLGFAFNIDDRTADATWHVESSSDGRAKFSFDPGAKAIAPPTATASATPTIAAGFERHDSPPVPTGPAFPPFDRSATVVTKSGPAPFSSKVCKLHVASLGGLACRATLTCGGKIVYGGAKTSTPCATIGGAVLLNDTQPTPRDGDPTLMLTATALLQLADEVDGGSYTVSFAIGD